MVTTRQQRTLDSQMPADDLGDDVGESLPYVMPVDGRIGPYELICELGAGGMGRVFAARRTLGPGVAQLVALKTVRPRHARDRKFAKLFLEEARITACIAHPYVCDILDMGSQDGLAFVAMEYLVGEPLSRVLSRLRHEQTELSVACMVRIVASLCEGLHAAHEVMNEEGKVLNVVHRDISPDNLFVLYDGTVRIVDFGIALANESSLSTASRDAVFGKVAYMSPEHLRGEPLDRRSDVWSMGVVLSEVLAGDDLFQRGRERRNVAQAVLSGTVPPPSQRNPLVPAALDEIVMKALSRDREQRHGSARELSRELEYVLASHFGTISADVVGNWLDQLFPGSQTFRRCILARSRAMLRGSREQPATGAGPAAGGGARFATDEDVLETIDAGSAAHSAALSDQSGGMELASSLRTTGKTRARGSRRLALTISLLVLAALAAVVVAAPQASRRARAFIAEAQMPVGAVLEVASAAPEAQVPLRIRPPVGVMPSERAETKAVAGADRPRRRPSGQRARPTPRTVEPQPVPMGRLYVAGVDASIRVGGRELSAPASLRLPAGEHVVEVSRKNGAKAAQFAVTVTPGRVTMLQLERSAAAAGAEP